MVPSYELYWSRYGLVYMESYRGLDKGKDRRTDGLQSRKINRRTRIAHKVGLHVRWIVLKNVIYLFVQNIHTYSLCKTMLHS